MWKFWLFRVKVTGESMWPELVPGKTYWATSLKRPHVGDIAVFRDGAGNAIVKKISRISRDGYDLEGLVSWSASYRHMPRSAIIGTLVKQLSPHKSLADRA